MSEKLIMALRTTVMGMGIVIITLYVLSLILDLMKYVFHPEKKDTTQKKHTQTPKNIQPKKKESKNTNNNEEIVAVISAALSAYLQKPISQIKIGTIRKIHTKTPIWGMVSRFKGRF